MPLPRSFSFDEEEDHLDHSLPQQRRPQHYHDLPERDIISPPPHYTSPAPPEPASPVSLSHAQPYTVHDFRRSQEVSRHNSPHRYTDRSPSPPPPPPHLHKTSPSRSSQRGSAGHGFVSATGQIPMEDFSETRSQAPSEQPYISRNYDGWAPQPGLMQQHHLQDRASPAAGPYSQRPSSRLQENPSYGSNIPLAAGAATPGSMTPSGISDVRSSHYSGRSIPLDEYSGNHPYRMSHYSYHNSPYHNSSHTTHNIMDTTVSNASIDPQNIIDDGDDDFIPGSQTHSTYPMQQRGAGKPGVTASVATVTKGGVWGGLLGRKAKVQPGTYEPVDGTLEKSDWLSRETRKRKRNGWLCGIGIGVVIVIAIVAGIVGGVMGTRSYRDGSDSDNNANDDTAANGDLDINSAEIKKLLNNPDLHKVFPGMDYTPWGVQYPLCMTYPPSQNNVTRDMAVLSQLTNTVRLYGTDCNQTEMVLHAIDRLQLKSMKIWLGVWIDTNDTTTDRQISQMYSILSSVEDKSIFKGAIIGNEALYRAGVDKAQSKAELIQLLTNVKSNFTSLGYDLPVATSDLGDNWDGDLVAVVDAVMSNIHPFFAGVSADQAAAWTWDFWDQHDVPLTASLPNVKQVISETGWPSDGGTDCGGTDGTCAAGQSGATASVDNMNIYMNDWVCQALANGTDYFWFEAFDEPWKVQYNTPGKEWEDKWGLMDAGRNLKSGVKIPSCGGKTVS